MKTKKLFLAMAVFFTSFHAVLAQEINFGIKAGANYSTLSGNEELGFDNLLGFHVGLISEFKLSPRFALQPELFYSIEGGESSFKMEMEDMFLSSEQKIRLGYLNLPVMAKIYATEDLSLQVGPQLGYLLSAKNEYDFSSNMDEDFDWNASGTADMKDQLKKISFGLNFGLGYELNENLFLQARYHLGLSDIDNSQDNLDEDPEMELELGEMKNQGFQVSVGYKF